MIRRASAAVCVFAAAGSAFGQAGTSPTGPFVVVGIPDTQRYSETASLTPIFRQQAQWTVDNAAAMNIRFTSHYGDVVQRGTDLLEWANAVWAMEPLIMSDMPLGVVPGNHDVTPTGTSGQPYDAQNFLDFFGPAVTSGRPGYMGASPSGRSTYQIFTGGGREFLALHLTVENPLDELVWAQTILAQNRDKPVMVTTHRYIQDADDYIPDGLEGITGLLVESGRYPSIWYTVEGLYDPTGMQSEEFWRSFLRTNRNIFLVNCGHFHEEFRLTSNNYWGHPVHQVLADYQDDPNGGDGWLRVMTFDTAAKRIDFETYSPFLNANRFVDESLFSLPVDFDAYGFAGSVMFQQGIDGYSGTRDTWVNEDAGNTSYGNNGTFEVDDDTDNSFFSDDRGQGLVRFDGIFTDTGEAGKIPVGATIESATLRLVLTNDVDFVFDADFDVYQANLAWNEGSTWNSLGNGVSGGEVGPFMGRFSGDNSPNDDFGRVVDVTAAVQAWANGTPNNGFVILPKIISGNDDGITIRSSENGNVIGRPALDVVFAVDLPCSVADIAEPFETLDLSDVQAFLIGFGGMLPEADLNGDSRYDLQDVQAFLIAFGAGCP